MLHPPLLEVPYRKQATEAIWGGEAPPIHLQRFPRPH